MKKIVLLLLSLISIAAYSQKAVLTTVNTVKPKNGQRMAFEAAYKVHIAKFHKASEKLAVFEVLSGTYIGYYNIINGGRSYADLDNDRPDASAHIADLDKTYFPLLQDNRNGTYRFIDSLSFHSEISADKSLVSIRHLKLSLLADYKAEVGRTAKVLGKLKGAFWDSLSLSIYEELWSGTDPVLVTVRNLKDGFKSLETDYYGPMSPTAFKDEYVRQYGTADWDKRVKLVDEAVLRSEQYIQKYRADLSSQ